jgi:hypothetical protein
LTLFEEHRIASVLFHEAECYRTPRFPLYQYFKVHDADGLVNSCDMDLETDRMYGFGTKEKTGKTIATAYGARLE